MTIVIPAVTFILVFAAWRFGLGSRNWLEGALVATVAAVLAGVAVNAWQRLQAKRSGDLGVRVRVGSEEMFLAPASASAARAAAVLPTQPSEDASHVLGTIDLPEAPSTDEYLPAAAVEWVITAEFPAGTRINPQAAESLFDPRWRKRFGGFMMYGLDADTGRWTFAVSSDGPRAVSTLKLAWDLAQEGAPAAEPALFEQRLAESAVKLKKLGEPRLQPSLSPADASRRASDLAAVKEELDQTVHLVLKAPEGRRFDGREVWDVMLSLGLEWGDMDCFHWNNPSGIGEDYFFSVETSTPPGYFLPEQIAAGKVQVEDLIFGFSIPRSPRPAEVFERISRAVEYCRQRLGGEIEDSAGDPADLPGMKAEVAAIEARLTTAGLPPGADPTLHLF